ncbi:hypothetical protein EHW99_2778 [Erwinia amylovora]|uniref:Uncharacterized protein n=3 Tax=Erwinia amylovora TaxID=552 RepID=A0A831A1U3_ERWAM|nr:hypothetical protein EaACW_0810 [Erwinia amylovora ACW56400]QJQ55478.1 hypothetical protein EHX00_2778 [Erwinia amylovora]CBA19752.1 hypothetical protein predicted by Glimmer/Critica [Erwinia amylovora CFBP1430]CBX79655.1 hypothetical protein predicted by Glimmer/Critica [Erwinia amylovora ATCC BAA-2158]CCO77656.1 hypothetical protein BN432_0829 [Erwinia amylovora Ea356]CCO81440.1 hypothetical protein BN433_0839 [Erwinia amylovora Ea266]CCO85242.1 hypothetical protein BN434_0825 [Erwinia a
MHIVSGFLLMLDSEMRHGCAWMRANVLIKYQLFGYCEIKRRYA